MERRDFLRLFSLGVFSTLACSLFPEGGNLEKILIIDGENQKMYFTNGKEIFKEYEISTSKYGYGTVPKSSKTPLGLHEIKEKIGDGAEIGAIFKYKKNTGKLAEIYNSKYDSPQDFVTTRILSLGGLEEKNSNSFNRAIYIHGTPEEGLIGAPASHGCIRMKNKEIVELYNLVSVGTKVDIRENFNFQ